MSAAGSEQGGMTEVTGNSNILHFDKGVNAAVEQAVAEIGRVVLGKELQVKLALCCPEYGKHMPATL